MKCQSMMIGNTVPNQHSLVTEIVMHSLVGVQNNGVPMQGVCCSVAYAGRLKRLLKLRNRFWLDGFNKVSNLKVRAHTSNYSSLKSNGP